MPVADGIHHFEDKLMDAAIAKLSDGTVKISREGKPAQTYFNTIKNYKAHTLVKCNPITGRMHQIRIHLTLLKAPITGDENLWRSSFLCFFHKTGFSFEKNDRRAAFNEKNGFACQILGIYPSERGNGCDTGALSKGF